MSTETETLPPADYERPEIPYDSNGNIFALIGIARSAMKRAGYGDLRDAMSKCVAATKSYDEALEELSRWVEFA